MSDLLVTSALLHESPIIDDSPPPTAAKTGFQLTSSRLKAHVSFIVTGVSQMRFTFPTLIWLSPAES